MIIFLNNNIERIMFDVLFCAVLFFIAMPKRVENAKIACLDFSLQKAKMHLGVSVVVEDPEQLEAIRKRYGQQKIGKLGIDKM